jgi:hypothetical protein
VAQKALGAELFQAAMIPSHVRVGLTGGSFPLALMWKRQGTRFAAGAENDALRVGIVGLR